MTVFYVNWFFIGDNPGIVVVQQKRKSSQNELTQRNNRRQWKKRESVVEKSVEKFPVGVKKYDFVEKSVYKFPSQSNVVWHDWRPAVLCQQLKQPINPAELFGT